MQPVLAQLPPAEVIQRKASEVVARPDYQLDTAVNERSLAWWREILRWILTPFRWLFEALEGLPDFLRLIIVILLVVICVALIAHIVWTFVVAIRGPSQRGRRRGSSLPDEQPADPAELVQQAEAASAAGQYIEAVRLLFRASLVRLEQAEKRKFRPGFTNRALLARYRSSPVGDPLKRLVEVMDAKWYGDEACHHEDYIACRQEHDRLQSLIRERDHAVGA